MLKQGEKVLQKQKNKNDERENNNNRYIQRKNKEFDKREQIKTRVAEQNRLKYKEILEQQIRERDERMKEEQDHFKHQAVIWGEDEKRFSEINFK